MACDPGLLFDDELLVCNFAEHVDCGERPDPTATSSSILPETSTSTTTTDVHPITSTTTITTSNIYSTTTTTHEDHERYPERVLGIYLCLGILSKYYVIHAHSTMGDRQCGTFDHCVYHQCQCEHVT